jgi:hypothetical protein
MTNSTKAFVAGAALAGLIAGATGTIEASSLIGAKRSLYHSQDNTTQQKPPKGKEKDKAADKEKHSCRGKNTCKGKGGCESSENSSKDKHKCKGQNTCKGKGGCATDGSKMPDDMKKPSS